MPFPPRDIRKNPRSMYARVPQAMAQVVLKIEWVTNYAHNRNFFTGLFYRQKTESIKNNIVLA